MGDGDSDEALQDSQNLHAAEAEVAQALRREAYRHIRTLTFWGAIAYTLFLPTPFLRFALPVAAAFATMQLVLIVCFLLLRFALNRGMIPLRYAHETLTVTLALPLIDLLVRSYVAYTPDRSNMVAMYLIAVGVFCPSSTWLAVLLGTTMVSWPLLVWSHPEGGGVVESMLPLAVGCLVGVLARNVRLGAVQRVQQLHLRDARHLHEARVNEAKFREEASVSAALAGVGEALIAALDEPALLARACRLTTEVLTCDLSHTYLRAGTGNVFTLVTAYGHTREHEEMLRALRLAPDLQPNLAQFLDRLEHDEVIVTDLSTQHGALAAHGQRHGIAHLLHVALRRGGRVIGFHAAGYYGEHEPFTAVQVRIFKGLAHFASLALENARLVSELGRASRLKSDFMATMSHELRTPLNIIMGFNDLLRGGTFGALTSEQLDAFGSIDRSTRELLDVIAATLDLSRLERGEMPLDIAAVDVAELVTELQSESGMHWQRAGRDVALHVPTTLPRLRTDRMKLKVVLKNLIGNAAKFTPEGRIDVDVKARGDGVEVSVADTGIGIAPEVLPTIFEPFRQGDPSDTRNHDGVGLGLYIVRRLIEALGGTVEVESAAGRGSTFRVWVPSSPAAVA